MKEQTLVERLCEILVDLKKISPQESKALQKGFPDAEKENFDEFLLDQGLIEKDDLLEALSLYYEMPAIDVVGLFFDTFNLRKFPKDVMLRGAFIPLEVDENIMVIVASEPDHPDLLPLIGDYVSYDIQFRVGLKRDICDAVKEYFDEAMTEKIREEEEKEQGEEQTWDKTLS